MGGGGRCMHSGPEGCTDVRKRKGHLSWLGSLNLRRLQRAKRERRGMQGEARCPNWHAGGPSSGADAFLVMGMCVLNHFSCVRLCATLWTTAHQASLPWDSPGKHTGVGCHFLLQGIFLTQGSNPHLLCLLPGQADFCCCCCCCFLYH